MLRPEQLAPLDAVGTLEIVSPDGDQLRLTGSGSLVALDVNRFRALLRLRRRLRAAYTSGLADPGWPAALVGAVGMEAVVKLRGRSVARLGRGVAPGRLSALLGLAPLRVQPLGLFAALFRRWRP